MLIAGGSADRLTVPLVRGLPYSWSITLLSGEWPAVPVIEIDGGHAWPAVVSGATATWSVSAAEVDRVGDSAHARLILGTLLWAEGTVLFSDEMRARGAIIASGGSTISLPSGQSVIASPPGGPRGEKGDPGDPGEPGPVDLATSTGTLAVNHGGTGAVTATQARANLGATSISDAAPGASATYSSSKIESLLYRGAPIGPLRECVIVGSSNALPGTWPAEFCAAWGLTQRNYAVGGGAFTGSGSGKFLAQLQAASADAAFPNASVGVVVIADASNDIRARVSVTTEATTALAYARAQWPNARILMLPVIWPADPYNNVTGVPGGYQSNWHEWLLTNAESLRDICAANGVEFVDQSWTWLTGDTAWMNSDGSVHPNAAGYTQVSRWLSKHLRGESTRRSTPWRNCGFLGDATTDSGRAPAVQREGWIVSLYGACRKPTAGTAGYTDILTVPNGFQPTYGAEVTVRYNGTAASKAAIVYGGNGTLRIWENVPAGTVMFFSGTWRYG